MGRTQHTKTDVVVTVVRVVPVAIRGPRVVLIVVPGPAAQQLFQDPPRSTRNESTDGPTSVKHASAHHYAPELLNLTIVMPPKMPKKIENGAKAPFGFASATPQ